MGILNGALIDSISFKILLNNPEYLDSFDVEFYEDPIKRELIKKVKKHFNDYKETPSKDQLIELYNIENPNTDLSIPNSIIKSLYEVDLNEYEKDWLDDSIQAYISTKKLEKHVVKLLTFLRSNKITLDNVSSILETSKAIITDGTDVSFNFDEGLDMFNASNHKLTQFRKVSSGYPFIDLVTKGGFVSPGLHVLAAPPKVGKTLWMGNIAVEMMKSGKNGVIISLEMPGQAMLHRLCSNMLSVSYDDMEALSEDPLELGKRLTAFKDTEFGIGKSLLEPIKPGELYVKEFPTSVTKVSDVESYLKRLMESKKIDLDFIVIDYINIMMDWKNPTSENTYLKIKNISEELRGLSQKLRIPVITATQTKRGTEDSTDIILGDIAESSGLSHTVDSLFVIVQNPTMYANREYVLKCLLNRHGGMKNARQKFNVDYNFMRIRQSSEEHTEGD